MIYLVIALTSFGVILLIMKTHSASAPKNPAFASWIEPPNTEKPDLTSGTAEEKTISPEPRDLGEVNRAYRIADMHFSRGDLEEAEKWFIKVLALHEDHTEALNRLGVIYIHQGNPRRAEILYRKLFSLTQKEPAYYCNYGRCLYNQGRLDDAIEAYENAVKLDATKPARFVSIGQIHYERKDHHKALAYFVRALELDPVNQEYLSLTAELAELTGDTERQQKSLRRLAELNPYDEKVKAKLGQQG